ncbi:hypothetical protein Vau01_122190 [Virgisporangium aurantiacum]|uniref:Uncharacterized protein n=1 Tax=Virgisporangium aurantiacum TaxID=175570 RepID=A0A8J3ZN73_9ACTN|nr:hypothetical protein Vau01_122190 [Virgisporangium aurantiacum]
MTWPAPSGPIVKHDAPLPNRSTNAAPMGAGHQPLRRRGHHVPLGSRPTTTGTTPPEMFVGAGSGSRWSLAACGGPPAAFDLDLGPGKSRNRYHDQRQLAFVWFGDLDAGMSGILLEAVPAA